MRLLRASLAVALLTVFAIACSDQTAPVADDPSVSPLFGIGPVVHHVSVGGADICGAFGLPPGCDANFSLTANKFADGSVTGQWQDTFFGRGMPALGVHIALNCLHVNGNEAWVSGVTTTPAFPGIPVITRVADNGESANDPSDQISFLFIDTFGGCTTAPAFPLFDLTKGQVTVR